MESGSTVAGPSTRKEKLHKRKTANAGEDRISKLPESLISHILSFLPTKDAVRTCVLSKRWIHRWTSITKLRLDDTVFRYEKNFVDFVNRALLLTKRSSAESFTVVIEHEHDVSLLNTWISSILNRSVKYLNICSHNEITFSPLTSHSLFNSTLLEELLLQMTCCDIKVPTSYVHFGCLKFLTLVWITFTIDSPGDCLILSLPVLKEFETINCNWISAKGVTVEAPLLERVCIDQDTASVSDEPHSCAMTFSALHLKEFTYRGCGISQSIFLSNPSSARNATANISIYPWEDSVPETGSCAFLLLKQFSQVKRLEFDGSEVLTQQKVADLPVFAMLSCLEFVSFITGEVLLGLLQKSPNLKTLVFKGISKFDQVLLNSAVVPKCLASTLQVVKFEKVKGDEHELFLAKFFMENGMMLQRMSFSLASQWLGKSKVMEKFKEKLYSFKKGFSFTIVEFSYD